jgi:hypothetical protein
LTHTAQCGTTSGPRPPMTTTSSLSLFIFYFIVIFTSFNPTMYRAKIFSVPNLACLLEARFEHAHALQISRLRWRYLQRRNNFSSAKLSHICWRCSKVPYCHASVKAMAVAQHTLELSHDSMRNA